ncbi:MAG: hypothetical protein ABW224_06365 [Kibdelosporangium sp.]
MNLAKCQWTLTVFGDAAATLNERTGAAITDEAAQKHRVSSGRHGRRPAEGKTRAGHHLTGQPR